RAPAWEEATLRHWAFLALAEGAARKRRRDGSAGPYLARAAGLADRLAKYALPDAASVRGQVAFLRGGTLEDARRELPRGIEAEFRAALKERPDHEDSWMWGYLLAALLHYMGGDRTPEELAELRAFIAGAKEHVPETPDGDAYREPIAVLYEKYHTP